MNEDPSIGFGGDGDGIGGSGESEPELGKERRSSDPPAVAPAKDGPAIGLGDDGTGGSGDGGAGEAPCNLGIVSLVGLGKEPPPAAGESRDGKDKTGTGGNGGVTFTGPGVLPGHPFPVTPPPPPPLLEDSAGLSGVLGYPGAAGGRSADGGIPSAHPCGRTAARTTDELSG